MGMLSSRELGQLLHLLDNEMVNKHSLESLCTRLHQSFNKQDNFKVGTALVTLLQHADLLPKPAQKLAAITFLYDMYKSDHVSLNPFAPVFIHMLNTVDNSYEENGHTQLPVLNPSERQYVTQLVAGQGKEFSKNSCYYL